MVVIIRITVIVVVGVVVDVIIGVVGEGRYI